MTKDISASGLAVITTLDKNIKDIRVHVFLETWLTVLACGTGACYAIDVYSADSPWLRIVYVCGVFYMGWLARLMFRSYHRSRYLLQHSLEHKKAVLALEAATNFTQLHCAGDQLMAVLQNFRPR